MGRAASGDDVAFVSPSGWGNLGDAAIVESLVTAVRRRRPGVDVIGFTLNPAATSADHGVAAFACAGVSRPHYSVAGDSAAAAGSGDGAGGAATGRGAWRDRVRDHPVGAAVRVPVRLAREVRHAVRTARRLRSVGTVVVAGGGQIDGVWGGAWGHPATLARFALLSRMVGARFVVVSVGTGTLDGAGRRLATWALRRAGYRSFRDARSRELAGPVAAGDPVVADLAYACPIPVRPAPGGDRLRVAVSPMDYGHPDWWPVADAAAYRRHVAGFAALAVGLVADGHTVVVVVTDRDDAARADLVDAVRAAVDHDARDRIEVPEVAGWRDLGEVLGGVDLVVSARLHGVLLAHVAGRPTLAVAHERKVRTLMEDTGLDRYCLDLDGFDPARGRELLDEVAARRRELGAVIVRYAADRRADVEAQYDRLFGPVRDAS